MTHIIGIRREDKSPWERRAPLTPEHVGMLVSQHGLEFVVQPSPQRTFGEDEYHAAGARIDGDLSGCRVVLGVKEVPIPLLRADTTYVCFAHVIKGQPYNMPTLARMLELGCTLVDYERVRDDHGHRLIHFGRFAGLAGTIDMLWALGRRLEWEGIRTPFEAITPAHRYANLDVAKAALRDAAARIRTDGLPAALRPLVVGITGRGNVSGGAHEILDCLPVERVDPEHLSTLDARVRKGETDAAHQVYTVGFGNRHVVEPLHAGRPFDKTEYRAHPERYRRTFHHHLPHLTALVNGIYWDARYPRLVTIDDLDVLQGAGTPRLRVIADITADIGGAIEATVKVTDPENPVFIFEPRRKRAVDGWKGKGPVILAVDFLPTELPIEASMRFGDALCPFLPSLARATYDVDIAQLDLPPELARAVIAHRGALAPDYGYIAAHLGDPASS